jgi:hypothetical protein
LAWACTIADFGTLELYWWKWLEPRPEEYELAIWKIRDEHTTRLFQAVANGRVFREASMYERGKRLFRLKHASILAFTSEPERGGGPIREQAAFNYVQYLEN